MHDRRSHGRCSHDRPLALLRNVHSGATGLLAACLLIAGVSPARSSTSAGSVSGYEDSPLSIAVVPNSQKAYATASFSPGSPIAVIDTGKSAVTGYVSGYYNLLPGYVGVSPDGRVAAALDYQTSAIYIIDTATDAVVGQVAFATQPDPGNGYFSTVAFSRDAKTAYATYRVLGKDDPGLTVIDVENKKATGSIDGWGISIASSPTQDKAYLTAGSEVAVIDTKQNARRGSVQNMQQYVRGFGAYAAAFSPDGRTAYIGGSDGNQNPAIVVVDAAKDTATGAVDLSEWAGCGWGGPSVFDVIFAPDGKTAFAQLGGAGCRNPDQGGTLVIDATTNTPGGTIPGLPLGGWTRSWSNGTSVLAASPDSKRVYLALIGQFNGDRDYIAVANLVPAIAKTALPSSGPAKGTQVTIRGANLQGTTAVYFGGADYQGKDLVVVSDSEITVTAPPHPVGVVDVTVVNPGGNATMPNGFTYITILPAP
ncbi:IPT/TIG domain-containing protein [Bordetella flabilis]|uniref:IPT/TIG domain-containing protein n=1 Tax=Bordetella flabilis TaxID=463014 RepID=UPI000A066C93|nr:IPT/TIG domain-containing protein [Bordetella flabilis]